MARYTADFSQEFDKKLVDLAKAKGRGTSKADIIRLAVASYEVLQRETRDNRKLSITDENDRVLKDIYLP